MTVGLEVRAWEESAKANNAHLDDVRFDKKREVGLRYSRKVDAFRINIAKINNGQATPPLGRSIPRSVSSRQGAEHAACRYRHLSCLNGRIALSKNSADIARTALETTPEIPPLQGGRQ